MASFAVILAAAGKSSRFKDPHYKKPFAVLANRAVWLHSAEKFVNRDDVKQLILVIDTILLPVVVDGMLLGLGEPALTQHETLDLTPSPGLISGSLLYIAVSVTAGGIFSCHGMLET